ncbi:MAG: WG repeat-containing protein [Clostridiales bacterium]|nr:WG repeat-containing protein [Clostridiales bacterium]
MKKFSIIILLICILQLTSCAVPVHTISFINSDGQVISEPVFYGAQPYSDGVFAVNLGGSVYGKWGYVDLNNQFIIDFEYDQVLPFFEGFAPVYKEADNKDWYYIDKQGNHAFGGKYFYEANIFSEGLAAVRSSESDTYGKWGYINTSGEYVIEPQFGEAGTFNEGIASVRIGAGESGIAGYIDKQGEIIIEPKYAYCGIFSQGLAPVKKTFNTDTADWGYINTKGEVVLDFIYGYARSFKNGLAPVIIGDPSKELFRYIDILGNTIIDAQFYDAFPFYEEKAAVKRIVADYDGWGYIDLSGKLIIGGEFASCSDFSNGYAAIGNIILRK